MMRVIQVWKSGRLISDETAKDDLEAASMLVDILRDQDEDHDSFTIIIDNGVK